MKLDSFIRSLKLKDETRSGWVLRGVDHPESVADHSWATAYLCLLYGGEGHVDIGRALQMAVVHDLAEAITGDVATRVAQLSDQDVAEEKRSRELAAMEDLMADLAAPDGHPQPLEVNTPPAAVNVRELWDEYEESKTPTALFVRDMNLIDMCAQALVYEDGGRYDHEIDNENFPDFDGMEEFFATTRPRLSTAVGKQVFAELTVRHAAMVRVRNGRRARPADSIPGASG